jgi:methylated-DNA-[protein]-cysteine S-methyltransferase
MKLSIAYMKSPVGFIRLSGLEMALMNLEFTEDRGNDESEPEKLQLAMKQLDEYFLGSREVFDLPLHPVGTHFQLNVWEKLQTIPYGKTLCYEDVARSLGDIKVIRAAATANGKNPLPIIIPCHRVISKNGTLGGYSGGLWRKKWLLDFEQKDSRPRLL